MLCVRVMYILINIEKLFHNWAPDTTHILQQVLRKAHSAVAQHALLCDLSIVFFFWVKSVCKHVCEGVHPSQSLSTHKTSAKPRLNLWCGARWLVSFQSFNLQTLFDLKYLDGEIPNV